MSYADFILEAAPRAVLKVTIALASHAKLLAPADSGLLRNSINWNTASDSGGLNDGDFGGRSALMLIHQLEKTTEPYVGYVGSVVEYAAAQEFGRPDINLPAQPYLRPAASALRTRAVAIMNAEFKKSARSARKKDRK
jgi:hypothetical protein